MTATITAIADPSGPAARDIASLWWLMLALGTAVYLLVLVLLVVPAVRRRQDGEPATPAEARPSVPSRVANGWIVGGGVVLPAVVLAATLAFSVATMRAIPRTAPPGSLAIDVVGHQWWWSVHYPAQQVTAANEIHIPVGAPVEVRVTSADVIHSFWVPQLAGKIDALPDGTNTLVLQADDPGEYRGHCAEFCGLQHAKMGMLVIAQPPDEFAAWIEDQKRPALAAATPRTERGAAVFRRRDCGDCHTVRGTSATATKGPDLTHFASRRTLAAATLDNTSAHLARWLVDPDSVKEGTAMPATRLGDEELDALVAYLESLE